MKYFQQEPQEKRIEGMTERQYSREEWQKILSRIKEMLDFPDLKYTQH